jgi:predicted RNase H-like HicB family nuclease
MVTLLAVYNSEGCQGRCDSRCYDAEQDECDCVCSGRNHGAGKQQALDNTRELAESWIERARANGQDVTSFELAVDAMHEPLFRIGGRS